MQNFTRGEIMGKYGIFKIRVSVLFFLSFQFINSGFANSSPAGFEKFKPWERINIPGAKCGNGSDYTVFWKNNSTKKLLVEFMGGGACWDKKSCVTMPSTWIYPMPELPAFSVFTSTVNQENPFMDHSFLYFPFCTGDVFTGRRISTYEGTKIYHYGYSNVLLALEHLSKNKIVDFSSVENLVVWGSSAGGIGALTHGKNIEKYVPAAAHKILIADSPGLHFGPTFWNKFADDAKVDFKYAFNGVRLDVDFNDGFVARKMGPVLEYYRGWDIGFLYSLRDRIMSEFFGEISKGEHQKLLLGPEGIPAIAKNYPYVKVWLANNDVHRFLLTKKNSHLLSLDSIEAIDFTHGF